MLLLLLSPGLRGTPDCSFSHSPISSTFAVTIRKLVRPGPSLPDSLPEARVLARGPSSPGSVSVCAAPWAPFWVPVPTTTTTPVRSLSLTPWVPVPFPLGPCPSLPGSP